MSNVRIFKLVSGEEVLARVEEVNETTVMLTKPRTIMVAGVTKNGLQISLIPWVITDPDGTFPLDFSHIMTRPMLSPDLELTYLNETSTIQLT